MAQGIVPRFKLLIAYDINEGSQEGYYQFVLRELVPAMQSMGLYMLEVYHTAYGPYPLRQLEFVAENIDTISDLHAFRIRKDLQHQIRRTNYVATCRLTLFHFFGTVPPYGFHSSLLKNSMHLGLGYGQEFGGNVGRVLDGDMDLRAQNLRGRRLLAKAGRSQKQERQNWKMTESLAHSVTSLATLRSVDSYLNAPEAAGQSSVGDVVNHVVSIVYDRK